MGATVYHIKTNTIADGTDTNLVRPSDWNSAHSVSLSLGADEVIKYIQAGTNSQSSGTVSFADSNGVSFGLNTNGVITASVTNPMASFIAYPPFWINTATTNISANGSQLFSPVTLISDVSMNALRLGRTVAAFGSTSFASTANTTASFNQQETHWVLMYSRGAGASSQSLALVASTSVSLRYSALMSYGSASNTQQGWQHGITFPAIGGSGSYSTTYTTSNLSTMALSTANMSALTGQRLFDIPWATSFSEGQYWLAHGMSSASTTQGTNMSGVRLQANFVYMSQMNSAFNRFGQVSTNNVGVLPGNGIFTTAGSVTTASLGFTNVSSYVSNPRIMATFGILY